MASRKKNRKPLDPYKTSHVQQKCIACGLYKRVFVDNDRLCLDCWRLQRRNYIVARAEEQRQVKV